MTENKVKSAEFKAEALPQLESLYRVASHVLENDSKAQDLVQESLITAYRSWPTRHLGPNGRVWLFKILASTYISEYRPFPTLSGAINRADKSATGLVSTQSANPQGTRRADQDSVGERIPNAIGSSQSSGAAEASQLSSRQTGDGLKQAAALSFNDALNSAFEFAEDWEPSDEQTTGSAIQDFVYSCNVGSNFEVETGSISSDSEAANSVENCDFSEISQESIKKAIRAIPDDMRIIVVLSLLEDFSHSEIADIVGVHLETVKSRLPQGRRLIRESFRSGGVSGKLHDGHRQSQE